MVYNTAVWYPSGCSKMSLDLYAIHYKYMIEISHYVTCLLLYEIDHSDTECTSRYSSSGLRSKKYIVVDIAVGNIWKKYHGLASAKNMTSFTILQYL